MPALGQTTPLRGSYYLLPQVTLKGSSIELGIQRLDLHLHRVHIHGDDTQDLILVAADPRRVPPPANLIARCKDAERLHHWQRRRLKLRGDINLLAWVRGLTELCERVFRR